MQPHEVAPRQVGRVLATTHEDVPWHRVVRADGSVPIGEKQVALLRAERVPMLGDRVDLPRASLPGGAAHPSPERAPRWPRRSPRSRRRTR